MATRILNGGLTTWIWFLMPKRKDTTSYILEPTLGNQVTTLTETVGVITLVPQCWFWSYRQIRESALSAQILPLTTRLLAGECSPRQRTTQVKLSTSIILPAESTGKLIQLTSKVWDKRGLHAFWALPRMEKNRESSFAIGCFMVRSAHTLWERTWHTMLM